MKKLIVLFISIFLVLMLFGCNSSNTEETAEQDAAVEEQVIPPTDAEGSAQYVITVRIPTEFGVAQYSAEEIRTFKDYSVEQLKESIHTISDLLQYLIECDFANPPGIKGDFKYNFGNYEMSLNRTPDAVLKCQVESCGAVSNLARYILEEDYDEVGFILQGEAVNDEPHGGHVYNYFRNGDKILTFDFTGIIPYRENGNLPMRKVKVEDFSEITHGQSGDSYLYTVVATRNWNHDHIPVVFGDHINGGRCYFFDSQYKDNLIVIFNDDEYRKKLSETSDFVYHELFEDIGYDPDTIPYEEMYSR